MARKGEKPSELTRLRHRVTLAEKSVEITLRKYAVAQENLTALRQELEEMEKQG